MQAYRELIASAHFAYLSLPLYLQSRRRRRPPLQLHLSSQRRLRRSDDSSIWRTSDTVTEREPERDFQNFQSVSFGAVFSRWRRVSVDRYQLRSVIRAVSIFLKSERERKVFNSKEKFSKRKRERGRSSEQRKSLRERERIGQARKLD